MIYSVHTVSYSLYKCSSRNGWAPSKYIQIFFLLGENDKSISDNSLCAKNPTQANNARWTILVSYSTM